MGYDEEDRRHQTWFPFEKMRFLSLSSQDNDDDDEDDAGLWRENRIIEERKIPSQISYLGHSLVLVGKGKRKESYRIESSLTDCIKNNLKIWCDKQRRVG